MIERLFDDIELTVVFGSLDMRSMHFSTQKSQMFSCLWIMKKRPLQRGRDKPYQNTNQEALPTRLLLVNSRLFIVKKEA